MANQTLYFIFLLIVNLCAQQVYANNTYGLDGQTLVKTTEGYEHISSLKAGDRIINFSFASLVLRRDVVKMVHQIEANDQVELTIGKDKIVVAPDQKFYVINLDRWVEAKDIKPGYALRTVYGFVELDNSKIITDKKTLYCLSIENNKNFLVTKNDIIVHNLAVPFVQAVWALVTNPVVLEHIAKAGIVMTASALKNKRDKELEAERRRVEQFDFAPHAEFKNDSNIISQLDPQTTTKIYVDGNPVDIPQLNANGSASLHRSIDRAIKTIDRIKPGHDSSFTITNIFRNPDEERKRDIQMANDHFQKMQIEQEREKEKKRIDAIREENLKSWPHKITTHRTVEKGWIWNSVSECKLIQLVSEEEYLLHRDNPTTIKKIEDGEIIIEYVLPESSHLACKITQEQELAETLEGAKKAIKGIIPTFDTFKNLDIKTANISLNQASNPAASKDEGKKEEKNRLEGAQAPGMPTEEDGFIPPKKWDGKKKKVQVGKFAGKYGYPDDKGRIWVPSGPAGHPNAHGGAHWDIQFPNGKHENRKPKIRQNISTNQALDLSLLEGSLSNNASGISAQNDSMMNPSHSDQDYANSCKSEVESSNDSKKINDDTQQVDAENCALIKVDGEKKAIQYINEITTCSETNAQSNNNENIKEEQEALAQIVEEMKQAEMNGQGKELDDFMKTLTQEDLEDFKKDYAEMFSKKCQ